MSAWAVCWLWTGEGMPHTARCAMEFPTREAARQFQEAVVEGRELPDGRRPGRWMVRCQDGVRRRLETHATMVCDIELVDRRRSAA